MIREGEGSKEDSLKITSDENFLKAWLWILISFVLDSKSSCDSEFRKCLNSQTWQNGWTTKLMHGRLKFDQNWKNQLDFIWKDFDIRPWRYKSHSILRCISWDSVENKLFTIRDENVCLVDFYEGKFLKFDERMICVLIIGW